MNKSLQNFIVLSLLFLYQNGYCQFNFKAEMEKAAKIPNSPEASAFTKYGDESVSLYSGTPNIQVPIHTISGRELDLPISLSYDATGIKVEQLATQAGLGWNLNVGGRISRTQNGAPDDFIYASAKYLTIWDQEVKDKMTAYIQENHSFNTSQGVIDYFNFLKDIANGKYETQADYFSLNALGINDCIVFDLATGLPRTLNNPRIKVESTHDLTTSSITNWVVTNEDGTKFYFDQAEETNYQGDDIGGSGIQYGLSKNYNSSWLLTKIESANKKDIYTLNYIDLGFWTQPQPTSAIQVRTDNMDDGNAVENSYPIGGGTLSYSTYKIKQKFLSTIFHNGIKQVAIVLKNRLDITVNSAIDKINLYNYKSPEEIYKTFTFNHSYFGNTTLATSADIRLKLDNIQISAPNTTEVQKYSFEYEAPSEIPKTNAMSQDYLGYFNGVANTVLYPKMYLGLDFYDGANRKPNFEYAKKGLLTKIIFPTKGFTVFEYEPHATLYDGSDTLDEVPTTVISGNLSLAGGFQPGTFYDATTECNGIWCQDTYPYPPKVAYSTFQITEAGYKDISFIRSVAPSGNVLTPSIVHIIKVVGGFGDKPCVTTKLSNYMDLSSCAFVTPSNVVGDFTNGFSGSVYFDAGCYQITIIDGYTGSTSAVTVSEKKRVLHGVIDKGQFSRAGIRIKSIKNYTDASILALEKDYQYTTLINGSDSSGKTIFNPQLSYTSSYLNSTATGIKTVQNMNRVSSASGGDTPHIGYSKVFEIRKSNVDAKIDGYTEYNFNTDYHYPDGYGTVSSGLPPFENYYSKRYELGKENAVSTFKEDDTKLSTTEYKYRDDSYYINKSVFIYHNPEMAYKYPKIVLGTNGLYTYTFVDAVFTGLGIPSSGIVFTLTPQPCSEPGCIDDPTLAANSNMLITSAVGRIGNSSQVLKTEYFPTGNVTQTVDNTYYDATNYFLQNESIANLATADQLKTKYYYPLNPEMATQPLIPDFVAKNKISTPLQIETYSGSASAKTSTQLTKFGNYSSSISGYSLLLPQYIFSGKEGTTEKRLTFNSYDTSGNLTQYTQENGVPVALIWGYYNTQPIAKIENATYTLVASQVANLQSISNTGTEASLLTALTTLRSTASLANAFITTFTYKPVIGVSTITDPKGDKITYNYDAFGRLQNVKDKDGNILSETEYHYKN